MNVIAPVGLAHPSAASASWTPERVDLLRRRAGDGRSAAKISEELGVTRNAVIGKADRHGIQLSGGVGGYHCHSHPRVAALRPTEPGSRVGKGVTRRSKKTPALHWVERPIAPVPGMRRLTIADLGPDDCRWPLGDPGDLGTFRYCGAQAADAPYCGAHARMAYTR